nr:MAG TPA: hypothetical protein [Caudoviricetes sp.]
MERTCDISIRRGWIYDLQIRKFGRMPGICRTGSERVRSNRGGSNLNNKKADVSETPAGSQ